MAQNDIYLVRQKVDGTFEEIAHSPFRYDAANITDLPDKANNTFHINTKLRVDELEVNGKTTVIHTDTNTSEQLLVTNDGTGPAAVINQLGQHPLIDIQDDGNSALFIRGDAPYGGFVGLGTVTPDEQLHLTGSILLENEQLLMAKNISNTKVNILGMTDGDITNLNNVGNGITMSVGASTASPKLFMHPTGKVGLGIETNEPDGLLELKRDGESNLLFSHRTASILATINVDKSEDKVSFKTITDHDLSFGTNALDFLTLSKEGNLKLEKKLSGSTLTGGDLTIDGNFTSNGDMVSFGAEELLFSKSLTSSGANVSKTYRVLEVGYNTLHWDHGTSFIIEVYSNHYSSQGYQKYILNHTRLDNSATGSQDGLVDKTGSRDYVLKILEHEGGSGSYEFRARLGAPEDTGVNARNFDVALVPLYIDVTNYADVRVKVTSFNSDNCKRISIDENWGASSADDEYKFNPLPTAEDITWTDHADLPGSGYAVAGRQAIYADVVFGDGRINRLGDLSTHADNIQWALKLTDTATSLTVPGKVGIGTASPSTALHIERRGSVSGDQNKPALVLGSSGTYGNYAGVEFRHGGNKVGNILQESTGNLYINSGHDPSSRPNGHLVLQQTSGNVGIGTKSPGRKLQIHSDTGASQTVAVTTLLGATAISHASIGHGTDKIGNLQLGNASGNLKVFLNSEGDSYLIGGNVGIGTTNPGHKLDIIGTNAALRVNEPNGSELRIASGESMGYLGTYSNHPLSFLTNSQSAMTIDSDGNVGIGTDSPSRTFDVQGEATFIHNDGEVLISNTADHCRIYSRVHSTVGPRDLGIYIGATERMRIDSSGNVGIGTTSPSAKLEVHTESNNINDTYGNLADSLLLKNTSDVVGAGPKLIFYNSHNSGSPSSTPSALIGLQRVNNSNNKGDLVFHTRGAIDPEERMRIDSAGNVGIGTTSPSAKLHIKTEALGQEGIIVENSLGEQTAHIGHLADGTAYLQLLDASGQSHAVIRDNGDSYLNALGGNVGIGTSEPSEKLHISAGKLLVAAYDIPIAAGDDSVAGATFFSRREPTGGVRYGSGIDIVPISEEGNCSPFIRFYDTAANADYDDTIVGDNNWAIGADDSGVASFNINWGGGANSTKPTSILGSSANSGINRLSIDGPTGVATFSGSLSIAETIRHTGDTNTYFGFPNNDQFSVVTNSSTRLLITATSTTVNNVLQANGGMTIATNEDNNTPELTLKRTASTSAGGSDDIVDIRVADSSLNFIINNDSDGDSGNFNFLRMVNNVETFATGLFGDLNINGNIAHIGDNDTYFGFHNPDQWRVVTGGSERLEVTNTAIALKRDTAITGGLTISGDLTVNGNLVTLNTSNLDIEDKVIKVAKNATNNDTADGSGISFGGRAELLYRSSGDELQITNAHLDLNTNNISNVGTYTANTAFKAVSTGSAMFILQDSNSTSSVTQTGNISYRLANGTVSAEIGYMSNSNSDFQIKTVDGDIDIRPGGSGHKLEYNGSEIATRTYVDNNTYSHPTFNSDDFSIDTQPMTGAKVISDLDINIATNNEGHVTDANGAFSTRDLTLADLGYTGATNANAYSHPTFNSDDFSIDTQPMTGAKVISDLDINIATNNEGHVTDANGTVSTRNLTLADLGYTGATNANNYSHPSSGVSAGSAGSSTKIPSLTVDAQGHVTALSENSISIPSGANNATITISNGTGISGGGSFTTDQSSNSSMTIGVDTSVIVMKTSGLQTMDGHLRIKGKNASNQSIVADYDIVAMNQASDERLKTNILKIDSALDKVCSLEGFTFDWNDAARKFGIDSANKEVGLSAQETEKVVPEAVKTFDESDYKYINYEKLVPVLVEAIKELKSEIQELKNNCGCNK